MSQPTHAIIRLKWERTETLTRLLNEAITVIVLKEKQEVRVVGQSHDRDEILYTLQIGK